MKIKKIKVLILLLFVFVCYFVYPNMKSFASDGETEGEEVIYLTSTNDELFGDGIDLPSKVFDNSKVKKIVLPQNAKYILSDYRYESDKAIVQNYESMTPNCPNLEQIEVEAENPYFTVVDGILYSKDLKVLYYCPPAKKGAVVLPDEVEVIQYLAFQECSQITSITFSQSLKTVYQGTFGGNNKLVTLKVSGDNPNFSVKSNVLFSKGGDILHLYPAGKKDVNYDVPYGVRRINPGAFLGNQYIKSIDIPETVSSIGIESFKNCRNLIKVKLREGLLDIEAGAFLNCSKLSELTFPDGLLNVYEAAISGCNSLLAIRLPESIHTAPQRLNEVKNRTIHCYSLYNASWVIHDPIVENNTIAYVYKGSKVADYVKEKGVTVKYLTPNVISTSVMTKAPTKAVKGKGKVDTSWYDAKKTSFTIKNPDQLAGLAKLVNQGKNMSGKKFILANDLDLSCYPNWEPIGLWTEKKWSIFKGTFDGKNHTIYNLRINLVNSNEVGLFGSVQGTVINLKIKDADVIGDSDVGILCGTAMKGSYTNCTVSGRVRGNEYVGGIIGRSSANISNSSSDVVVKGIKYTGGIIGSNSAVISKCTSMGEIFSYDIAGGISGHSGEIINSTNKAIVKGSQNVGGIAGTISSHDTVKNCTNNGLVTGKDYIGGISGRYDFLGTIEKCNNRGNVTGRHYVGGIVGENSIGNTNSCTNYGSVTGVSFVGGVIGLRGYYSKEEEVVDCINKGKVVKASKEKL